MERLTTTPFGQRPVTAGLIDQILEQHETPRTAHFNKRELMKELTVARAAFGVSDRDVAVLSALVSFDPDQGLSSNAPLMVFPSNKALSERLHGMPESTLRRHLAALVKAGLIARHDSPNGKRYAHRDAEGNLVRAFGFDLRPLLRAAPAIVEAARAAREAAQAVKALREEVILLKRDAIKLAQYGADEGPEADWEGYLAQLAAMTSELRRKPVVEDLRRMRRVLVDMLGDIKGCFLRNTTNMSGNDVSNERHYQNSKQNSYCIEPCQENGKGGGGEPLDGNADSERVDPSPTLPLFIVLKACPDILPYANDRISHWHELVQAAEFVRGMMGISLHAWNEAVQIMGPEVAAITVAGILQRVTEINSPGGYLRALTRKAQAEGFSPGPMIMALLNADGRAS